MMKFFFSNNNRISVKRIVELEIKREGIWDYFVISTCLEFPNRERITNLRTLCPDYVANIEMSSEQKERFYPFYVREGDKIILNISYPYGGHINVSLVDIIPKI